MRKNTLTPINTPFATKPPTADKTGNKSVAALPDSFAMLCAVAAIIAFFPAPAGVASGMKVSIAGLDSALSIPESRQ